MLKLKPCPFCLEARDLHVDVDANLVICGGCYATGPEGIEAWNDRVTVDDVEETFRGCERDD